MFLYLGYELFFLEYFNRIYIGNSQRSKKRDVVTNEIEQRLRQEEKTID